MLDTALGLRMADMISKYVAMGVMMGNVIQMNNSFIVLGILAILFSIVSFIYMKPLIIESQKLSLQKLNPLFNLIS